MTHLNDEQLLASMLIDADAGVQSHLARCGDCAGRADALRAALAGDEVRDHLAAKSDRFWEEQRGSIRKSIERLDRAPSATGVLARWAVAASLLIAAGGGWMFLSQPQPQVQVAQTATQPAPLTLPTEAVEALEMVREDPWETEALSEFGAMVEWESWLASSEDNAEGDPS